LKNSGSWRFAALILGIMAGCSPSGPQTPAQRGRIVYMNHCIVCHNINPNLPGAEGPAIAGSSQTLLRDRVLHLTYPLGYKPKRDTHLMRAFPRLAAKIGDLTAYLQAAAKKPADDESRNSASSPQG
jgi:mono/diheme cytochrome c family protein